MHELDNLIYSDEKLSSLKFFSALIDGSGIQEIVDVGYELLGNPITVIDASYKQLAITKYVESDNSSWKRAVQGDFLPYDELFRSETTEFFQKARNSRSPVLNKPKNHEFEVLQSAIYNDNKLMGYLIIVSHKKPFEQKDMEIATLLTRVISLEMQKNRFYQHSEGLIYEYFIGDLLEGNITRSDVIEERLKTLKWMLQKNIHLISISWKKFEDENLPLVNFSETIRSLIPNCKTIIYNNKIIVIISSKKSKFAIETDLKNLLNFMQENDLMGCVSRCFHSLAELPVYYKQSAKAVELCLSMNIQKVLFSYDEYAMYHFMSIYASQEALKSFCHPSLFILSEYDVKYGTQLAQCLYEYLTHEKNLVKAANVLGIHRNTLRLRIDKIVKLTNLDIENADTVLHLMFSYKILQYISSLLPENKVVENEFDIFRAFPFHVQ